MLCKSTFSKVFCNLLISRLVFNHVHIIHRQLAINKTLKWKDLIESPKLLIEYSYLKLFKEYYKRNNIKKLYRSQAPLGEIIRSRNLDALKFIIEELQFDYHSKFYNYIDGELSANIIDLYSIVSQINGNLEMLKYLDTLLSFRSRGIGSHGRESNTVIDYEYVDSDFYEWDYFDSLYEVSQIDDMEMIKYVVTKAIETGSYRLKKSLKLIIGKSLNLGRVDLVEWILKQSPIHIKLDRRSSICSAVSSGKLSVVQYCLASYTTKDYPQHSRKNFLLGDNVNLDIMKWLHTNNLGRFTYLVMDSASDIEVIKWLHLNRTEGCSNNAMNCAANFGNLEVVKWLHLNRTEGCTSGAMDSAAENGHLEVVQWLHYNRTEGCTIYAINNAAKNGHLEIVKWLHLNRTEGCSFLAFDLAAAGGHLEVLKWLVENRTEGGSTDAMDDAAQNGKFEIVKWLHFNRTEGCTTYAMDSAAESNYMEIVKWLHINRTEGCSEDAMNSAAQNGYFEMVQWLHENRIEGLTSRGIKQVALKGHFEMLKWIYENREERCDTLLNFCNHIEICHWLNTVCGERISPSVLANAISYQNLEKIQWIYSLHPEVFKLEEIDHASKQGNLTIIKWMHIKGIGCTPNAMDTAATFIHLDVIKWLHHNRTEGCTTDAMDEAIRKNNLEIFKWLHENRTEGFTNRALLNAKSKGRTKISVWLQENGYLNKF